MLCFRYTEFRRFRVKRHLQALEQNGMIDAAFVPLPAENPVSQNQLNPFRFAFSLSIEFIQRFENSSRSSCRPLVSGPFITPCLPCLKCNSSICVIFESNQEGL